MRLPIMLVGLVVVTVGCGGPGATTQDGGNCDSTLYACGPYGYVSGSVIENISVTGRRDLNRDGMVLNNPVVPIHLADYYQDKNLKVLVISLAASWCVPCVNEQPMLVQMYGDYQSGGPLGPGAAGQRVAFLQSIIQDQSGRPADQNVVDAWISAYKTTFDMSADPMGSLVPYYDPRSFPVQIVIKTSTMEIVHYNIGAASEGQLRGVIDHVLSN